MTAYLVAGAAIIGAALGAGAVVAGVLEARRIRHRERLFTGAEMRARHAHPTGRDFALWEREMADRTWR